MTRPGRLIFSVVIVLALCPASLRAEDPAPYEMARTLQTLQAQIAEGNGAAVTAQRALLAAMEQRFLSGASALWRDPRNARAAVGFTLSGGNPRVMRQLLTLDPPLNIDANLAQGALAYVEGRESEAKEFLLGIDARKLPATLGGHVALIQAGLVAREDLARASKFLDDARLLMPGTLVEEAALRRQVFIVAQLGDLDRFEFLSSQYLRRFNSSIYSADFRQRFATAIARLSVADSGDQFRRLQAMLKSMDGESELATLLTVARSSVVHGKIETAELAAEQALVVATFGSGDAARARLYGAAAGIATDRFVGHQRELKSISRRQLGSRDSDLLDAAITVAAAIRHWPDTPGGSLETVQQISDHPAHGPDWVSDVMRHAETEIQTAQKLLSEAPAQ